MGKRLELFSKGKPLSRKAQIEYKLNNPLIHDEKFRQQYRQALENKGRKSKNVHTIEQIVAAIKKELKGEECLDGFERGIGRVSASKLTTYRGCHFAYVPQYRLHLQPPVLFSQLVFGECFHHVLADFNMNNLTTLDELIYGKEVQVKEGKLKKRKIKGWKARWYSAINSRNVYFRTKEQPYVLYNKGVELLGDFFEKEKHKPKPQPEHVERRFDVVLDCRPYGLNASYPITGVFDKIDVEKDQVVITDYKTGHVGSVSSDFGLQLTLYWYAYNKCADRNPLQFPEPKSIENIKLVIYHIPTLEEICTSRSDVNMKYLINEIHNADNDIKARNFSPFIGNHCDTACHWQELCHDLLMRNNKELFNSLISPYTEKISARQGGTLLSALGS